MERGRLREPPVRPLVLLVDGHDDTLALYAIALSALGFNVTAAEDGTEAFRRACQLHPDIIVTELTLRYASGWDLLGQLRRDPRTHDIPVVVLTGDSQALTHARAIREGSVALLVKPCPPDQLVIELRDVLQGHAAHARASSSG
jgi:two-component system phosphate regulon response regulator PhoB